MAMRLISYFIFVSFGLSLSACQDTGHQNAPPNIQQQLCNRSQYCLDTADIKNIAQTLKHSAISSQASEADQLRIQTLVIAEVYETNHHAHLADENTEFISALLDAVLARN